MKALFRLSALGLVILSLVACGKSSEEKAQDHARSLAQEQNALANWLNSEGTPSSSWSDDQLDTYEQKLNQLESVEAQLQSANGQNGIHISGGNNSDFIKYRRNLLRYARAKGNSQNYYYKSS